MADYATLLKSWGDSGSAYPDGYSYLEGEQPVDAWDNHLIYNVIEDLKRLIQLTNSRIESDKGGTDATPSSPESAHLFQNTDEDTLNIWNTKTNRWNRLLVANGDTLEGALDFDGYAAKNLGSLLMRGTADLNGNGLVDGPRTLYDPATHQFSDANTVDGYHANDLGSDVSNNGSQVVENATDINFAENLSVVDDGDGTVTIKGQVPDADLTDIAEDGTKLVANAGEINFTGFLNVVDDGDGTVTVDPSHNHDGRYYTESQIDGKTVTVNAGDHLSGGGAVGFGESITINLNDGSGSGLVADKLDGKHASAFVTSAGGSYSGNFNFSNGGLVVPVGTDKWV